MSEEALPPCYPVFLPSLSVVDAPGLHHRWEEHNLAEQRVEQTLGLLWRKLELLKEQLTEPWSFFSYCMEEVLSQEQGPSTEVASLSVV